MNYNDNKSIYDFLGGRSMKEIIDNAKKDIEKEYHEISQKMYQLMIKYPEVAEFKSLYDRQIQLENKLKEYDYPTLMWQNLPLLEFYLK